MEYIKVGGREDEKIIEFDIIEDIVSEDEDTSTVSTIITLVGSSQDPKRYHARQMAKIMDSYLKSPVKSEVFFKVNYAKSKDVMQECKRIEHFAFKYIPNKNG